MSTTYYYDIPGVMCGDCTRTIEDALRASPFFGRQVFSADPLEKRLTILLEDEQLGYLVVRDRLNEVLDRVGFSCVEVDESSQQSHVISKQTDPAPSPWLSHHVLGGLGISVGVLFMLVTMLAGPLPFIVTGMMAGLSVPLTLFLGAESYQKALKKWKLGKLTMDTLFSISTLTILLVSSAAFFFPTLPMMFEAGLLIFGFRHVGIAIEDAFKRTGLMIPRFQDDAPDKVWKRLNGVTTLVPLALIKPGDELVLSTGAIIPLDGVFDEGAGLISDRIVTGASKPRPVILGERLYAGTELLHASSPLVFRALFSAVESHLARLDGKIMRAKSEKAPLETATSRIIQYFIPAVVCLAIGSGVLIACFFSNALAIQCAVSVLVSACPCTLGLITPLAVKIGMRKTAAGAIVFNSAQKLEAADNIQCVVFDLNGTLTRGAPRVVRYRALAESGMPDDALLGLLAYFERNCAHPTAKAMGVEAELRGIPPAGGAAVVQSEEHAGLVVQWEGETYTLGSEAMMVQHGIDANALDHLRVMIRPQEEDSVVYLARAGRVIGYVVLHDTLRDDAIHVIATLKAMGKQVHLCTGADRKTALLYSGLLGISPEHVRANCVSHASASSTQSKKNYLDELKAKGFRVAAVGDAGNDAEMIAASDVGFAMQSDGGDEHTQQQAAAVIQGKALLPIVQAFSVAEHMVANIKQNLIFSLVYNIATVLVTGGLLLTLGVVLNPAIGAALMIIQTSLILLNVRRFATQQTCTDAVPVTESKEPAEALGRHVEAMSSLLVPRPALVESATHRDANVPRHGNGMRLTDTNSEGCNEGKGCLDQRRDLLGNGFYERERIGLNERAHVLTERIVVNGVG